MCGTLHTTARPSHTAFTRDLLPSLERRRVCEAQLLAAPAVGGCANTHQLKGYRRNHTQSRPYNSNPTLPILTPPPPPPPPKQAIVERQQSGAQLLEVRAEVVQSFAQKMESETSIIFHECDCTLSFQIVLSQQPPHDDCLFSLECDFDPRCSARRSVLLSQSCQREIRVRKIPQAPFFTWFIEHLYDTLCLWLQADLAHVPRAGARVSLGSDAEGGSAANDGRSRMLACGFCMLFFFVT
jgi:hypothetical protein